MEIADFGEAIPSVSRTFLIPNPSTGSSVSITLCEPSLTADNLGHKTWLASYLLAKRLPYLIPYIPSLSSATAPGHLGTALFFPTGPHILELGAGTGLLGIAAATLFPSATIHLTDLPAIIPNLQANVSHSMVPDFQSSGTQRVTVGALDWSIIADEEGQPMSENLSHSSFDIILAADPLYSPLHPAWLVDAITSYLKRAKEARAIVELPLRECYQAEIHDFLARMADRGLELIEEGEEVGTEDWEDLRGEEERAMVKCWWGIWRWEKSLQ